MHIHKFILTILLTYILTASFGQSHKAIKEYEQLITGSWKVDTILMKDGLQLGEYYDLYVEKFKEIKERTLFTFETNKTYKKEGLNGISKTGKWKISPEGKRIIVKMDDNDKEEESKIIKLTADTLIITPLEESSNSKVILYKFVGDE